MKYAQYDQDGNIIAFYSPDIHKTIPSNTIQITEEQWQGCLVNQGRYKVINNQLSYSSPEPPTQEELINNVIRPIRDIKIRELQDRVERYQNQIAGGMPTTETPEKISQIYQVMQQLRDFPATCEDPFNPTWPDEGI
jgi:hypothetical protein